MNWHNDSDPFACEWARNLIADGIVPPGVVDCRDIREVKADDLGEYAQCHFFSGILGWPLALRLAGVGPDAPLWTGSCPCQPFSAAGKRKGEADDRHLWPEFLRLIALRLPPVLLGEQVASADGRRWLAGVRADLERLGYAVGAADLPAAGVGAPHIRQRLFFGAVRWGDPDGVRGVPSSVRLADSERAERGAAGRGGIDEQHGQDGGRREAAGGLAVRGDAGRMADLHGARHEGAGRGRVAGGAQGGRPHAEHPLRDGSAGGLGHAHLGAGGQGREDGGGGDPGGDAHEGGGPRGDGFPGGMGHAERAGVRGGGSGAAGGAAGGVPEEARQQRLRPDAGAASGDGGGMGHPDGGRFVGDSERDERAERGGVVPSGPDAVRPSLGDAPARKPLSTAWAGSWLLPCRDGRTRRVGPGLFPLAHGIPRRTGHLVAGLVELGVDPIAARRIVALAKRNRTGRLRGYGNAIVVQAAATFVRAFLSAVAEMTR